MFMFDIETLGIESNSVILSFSCIYFDAEKNPTYDELLDSAYFVKLDVTDQMARLGRTSSKSTMEWWAKQSPLTREVSFTPSSTDVKAEDAIEEFRKWTTQFPNHQSAVVWARGNLDQMAMGSLETVCGVKPVFHFGRWRDVRTAVDLLTGSNNGYSNIKNFDETKVVKHDPRHDCAYDIMMLLYAGK